RLLARGAAAGAGAGPGDASDDRTARRPSTHLQELMGPPGSLRGPRWTPAISVVSARLVRCSLISATTDSHKGRIPHICGIIPDTGAEKPDTGSAAITIVYARVPSPRMFPRDESRPSTA